MQNNFLTSMKSMKMLDGSKSGGLNPSTSCEKSGNILRPSFSIRTKSIRHNYPPPPPPPPPAASAAAAAPRESLLAYGIPSSDQLLPSIDPFLRPLDLVSSLAASYRRSVAFTENAVDRSKACDVHLEQFSLFRAMDDAKLQRHALRAARVHAPDPHHRVVLSAWLRFERRPDEFDPPLPPLSDCSSTSPSLECPGAALDPSDSPVVDPVCPCQNKPDLAAADKIPAPREDVNEDEIDGDVWFCIGEDEVACHRSNIAALSKPLSTLLYGGFAEARRERIDFTRDGISIAGMRAVDAYSRDPSILETMPQETLLELLAFSNMFCCDGLKSACDAKLATLVRSVRDAVALVDHGLDETAYLLVAACLQAFLRDLPKSLSDSDLMRLLCSQEGKERLSAAGNTSFALYYFLSQVSMEEDLRSNTTVMLLERLGECALPGWQKMLAFHQLGCVMLERGEYKDAQRWFLEAANEGHLYSLVGVARAKFKRGHRYAAYKLTNSLIDDHEPAGWMFQERSLYCVGKEKMTDLWSATELDPTLSYPYKYRAAALLEEGKIGAAIAEINKILTFKVTADCLELRAWFYLVHEDYEAAMQDVRAVMTLDPNYMMFSGKVPGDQLVEQLWRLVHQWDMADCWMQLYDRWSAVDDIGSLAVVHQMLAKETGNSSLIFRQSLLLLRLNCQKAAMQSLRLARNCSVQEHERLVYEGWILYDTGHRTEALTKAEESIVIQRSFEAFFLKAYALGDSILHTPSALAVIQLLEQANSCASDNLRKGQAYNNMGSIYVDCEMLDEAAECYVKALGIKHTRAHQGLARVHYLKNRKKAAYDEMTKLIEKAKNNASAYEKRSEYCERDMAKSDLNMATRLDPTRTYPYRYRAAVLMDDHKEEEAIAELSQAISFKPDLHLLHLRAAFYDSMGRTAATIRDCEAALCLDPAHGDTLELYNKACRHTEPGSA